MRFHLGDIPESSDFVPNASWRPMGQASVWKFQAMAVPIGFVAAALMALLWVRFTPLGHDLRKIFPLPLAGFAACLVGVLAVHELLHVAVHPSAGLSRRSLIGFWPSRMFLYAAYDGELTRNRLLAILMTPFLVISGAPLLVVAAAQAPCSAWVAYITILNAYLACGDLLCLATIPFKVPASATIRSTGWKSYWKDGDTRAGSRT